MELFLITDLSRAADLVTVLFLLWFGLKHFIPALDRGFFPTLGAVLAIAAAILIFLT